MNAQNIMMGDGRYCARIAQVSSKKKTHEILLSSSNGAGSVTQWMGSESKQYEWGFEKRL